MAYIPFPTGTVLTFAGSTAPDGWLLCDGATVSRTTYARLFAVLSTTYGVGDGSTTFTLPDMRGVYPRGAGTNSTANYGGVTGHTPAAGVLGSKGGQKTAKNGLTASSSTPTSSVPTSTTPTVSGTTNITHSHGSTSVTGSVGGSDGSHSHAIGTSAATVDLLNWEAGGTRQGWGLNVGSIANGGRWKIYASGGTWDGESALHGHGLSLSAGGQSLGTSNASLSGTVSTPTISAPTISTPIITVGAGDTETTPAFLAINYIIKL